MTDDQLIKLLEEHLVLEKESSRRLRAEQKQILHPGIKVLFEICAADSVKHATILQIMLEYLRKRELSRETPGDTWRQRVKGVEAIKEHVEREKQMIGLLKTEMLATRDKMLKAVLKLMVADEERHHEILRKEIWEI